MENKKYKIMFICGVCKLRFATTHYEQFDYPEREEHPFDYKASCSTCGHEAGMNPAQLNLFKAWVATSKPREGQALANIREGNKKKNTDLSRFNALTTGLHARVARFFPAREGKYAACETCDYYQNGCGQLSNACLKRAELFLQAEIAYENKDPTMLNKLMSDNQAATLAIQSDMASEIALTGVVIHDPVHYNNKETGRVELAMIKDKNGEEQVLTEVREHPLLKRFIEFTHKNGQTLVDMGMTARQQEEEKTLKGFLVDEEESRQEARERQELFVQRQAILLGKAVEGMEGIKNLGEPLLIDEPVIIDQKGKPDGDDNG